MDRQKYTREDSSACDNPSQVTSTPAGRTHHDVAQDRASADTTFVSTHGNVSDASVNQPSSFPETSEDTSFAAKRRRVAVAKAQAEAVLEAASKANQQRLASQERSRARGAERRAKEKAFTVTNVKTTPFPSSLRELTNQSGYYLEDDDDGDETLPVGVTHAAALQPPPPLSSFATLPSTGSRRGYTVAPPTPLPMDAAKQRGCHSDPRLSAPPAVLWSTRQDPCPPEEVAAHLADRLRAVAALRCADKAALSPQLSRTTSSNPSSNSGASGVGPHSARGVPPSRARRGPGRRSSGVDSAQGRVGSNSNRHRSVDRVNPGIQNDLSRGPASVISPADHRDLTSSRVSQNSSRAGSLAFLSLPTLDTFPTQQSDHSPGHSQTSYDVSAQPPPLPPLPAHHTGAEVVQKPNVQALAPQPPPADHGQAVAEAALADLSRLPRVAYQRVADAMPAPVLQEVFNRYMDALIASGQHLRPAAIDVGTGRLLNNGDIVHSVLSQVLLFQFDRVDRPQQEQCFSQHQNVPSPWGTSDILMDTSRPRAEPSTAAHWTPELSAEDSRAATMMLTEDSLMGTMRSSQRAPRRLIPWDAILDCLPQPVPLAMAAASPELRRRAEQRRWLRLLRDVTGDGGAFAHAFSGVTAQALPWWETPAESAAKAQPGAPTSGTTNGLMDLYECLDGREVSCPPLSRTPVPRHTTTAPVAKASRDAEEPVAPDTRSSPIAASLLAVQRQALLVSAAWRCGLLHRWHAVTRHYPAPYYESAENVTHGARLLGMKGGTGWEGPRLGPMARIRVNQRLQAQTGRLIDDDLVVGTATSLGGAGAPPSAAGSRVTAARSSSAQPISVVLQQHLERRASRLQQSQQASVGAEALAPPSPHQRSHELRNGKVSLGSTFNEGSSRSDASPESNHLDTNQQRGRGAAAAAASLPEMPLAVSRAGAVGEERGRARSPVDLAGRGNTTTAGALHAGGEGRPSSGARDDGTHIVGGGCWMEGLGAAAPLIVEDVAGVCRVFFSEDTAPSPDGLAQGWLQHRHQTRLAPVGPALSDDEEEEEDVAALRQTGRTSSFGLCSPRATTASVRPLALHITEAQLPWLAKQLTLEEGGLPQLVELHCALSEADMRARAELRSSWAWVKSTLAARGSLLLWSVTPRAPQKRPSRLARTVRSRQSVSCAAHALPEVLPARPASATSPFPSSRSSSVSDSSLPSSDSQEQQTTSAALQQHHVHPAHTRFSLRRDALSSLVTTPSLHVIHAEGISVATLEGLFPVRNLATTAKRGKDTQTSSDGCSSNAQVASGHTKVPYRRVVRDVYVVVGRRSKRSASPTMSTTTATQQQQQHAFVTSASPAQSLEVCLDGELLPSIEVIWIDAPRIRQLRLTQTLAHLRELHLLLDLTFLSSSLAGLEKLPHLQVLHLEHILLNNVSFLGESASLRELLLHSCRVSILNTNSAALLGVERAPALEVLSLAYTHDIKDVTNFAACRTLRKIALTRCNGIRSSSIAGLHTLPKLTALSLEYTRVSSVAEFANCPTLTTLRLGGCKRILRSSILGLEMCAQLRELSLSGTNVITVANLGAGGSLIASLDLSDCSHLDVDGLQGIQGLRALEVLNLSRTPLTDLRFLEDCPALISLYVEGCDALVADATDGLQHAPQLRRLVMDGCSTITEAGKFLRHCRRLQALSLAQCTALTTDSLMGLEKIATLEYLDLTGCVKLSTVHPLCHGCRRLRVLRLAGCAGLTEEGLLGLEGLPELADLDLSRLVPLRSANFLARSAALRRLSLVDCPHLTYEGVSRLLNTHIQLLL